MATLQQARGRTKIRMSNQRARWRFEALEERWVLSTSSTFLPNGADLFVSIDDPETSHEFVVPVGEETIDIEVTGKAGIGVGQPDATFIYAIDVSGSTDVDSGSDCSPILNCEKEFIKALNSQIITSGQADEVGVVVFATSAATADMSPDAGDQLLTTPDAGPGHVNTVVDSTFSALGGNGGVGSFTNKIVGDQTNCTGGLQGILTVHGASTNGTNIGVLVSDGLCDNSGGGGVAAFDAAIADLAAANIVVNAVATGAGSSCNDSEAGFDRTLQDIADGTGGECFEVADPGDLPEIIPDLTGATLTALEIEVNGGGKVPISNIDIDPDLPQDAIATVNYTTPVTDLVPGDYEICVTAHGQDVTGGTGSVTQCETIHVLQLEVTPKMETNELGMDNSHTVTATVLGDAAYLAANPRPIEFVVTGQNAGALGVCSPNADCTTDVNGQVFFTYSVPIAPTSLGLDTITVSMTTIGNEDPHVTTSDQVTKEWVDTMPPVAGCIESVNPHGKKTPPAGSTTLPGPKGGQNDDGFYRLLAVDDVWAQEDISIYVNGLGPFAVGDVIKYTEARRDPVSKKIGSDKGQAGAVAAHVIANGDASIVAIDGAGNASEPLLCLVPPPPK